VNYQRPFGGHGRGLGTGCSVTWAIGRMEALSVACPLMRGRLAVDSVTNHVGAAQATGARWPFGNAARCRAWRRLLEVAGWPYLVGLTALHHPTHLLMLGIVAGAVFKACHPLSDESAEALMRGLFDLTPVLDPARSKSARADPLKRQYLELSANPCCRRFITSAHRLPVLQRRPCPRQRPVFPLASPCHAALLSFACPPFVDISTVDHI
jgi:uncharacterized protein YbaR (Trm112 family)